MFEAAAETTEGGTQQVRGTVTRVTYRNPDNNYTILKVQVSDHADALPVVGYCLPFSVGTEVLVEGTLGEHPKYGPQFEAHKAKEVQPETPEGILQYLGSGLIPGIGPKTAERIVKQFGTDTMKVLYEDPDALTEVSGIGQSKVTQIKAAIAEKRSQIETERFLVEHQITGALLHRVMKAFGDDAIAKLREDPYQLAYEVRGIGFKTADSIALQMGFSSDSPHRLKAGLFYALDKARNDGHTYLLAEHLSAQTRELLSITPDTCLKEPLQGLLDDELVVEELHENTQRYYLRALFDAESFVARFVVERMHPEASLELDEEKFAESLQQAGEELGLTFSPQQSDAVKRACAHRLMLLTGGPGCGKTTVVRAILTTFLRAGKVVALAAPTGKAAQRMSEVCQYPSQTIHRLLKYNPRLQRFTFGIGNPLRLYDDEDTPQDIDLLIVDEASMIDTSLARSLFSSLSASTALILVGDQDQLPSVGPGRVFGDLLAEREIPSVALSQLFRRSEASRITSIAHLINSGLDPQIPTPEKTTESDAFFVEVSDAERAGYTVERLLAERIPRTFGISGDRIQVLTPTNRGALGTEELNRRLQNALNPVIDEEKQIRLGDKDFRVGDRVCQRVNNYKLGTWGVFNGDLGTVSAVSRDDRTMEVELWDGRLITYDTQLARQLSLSYAMTIHRSQGSEIPCCVLTLHESQFTLLERQLFYTAVTRAKELLIIVGSKRALTLAYQRTVSRKRSTGLLDKIRKLTL